MLSDTCFQLKLNNNLYQNPANICAQFQFDEHRHTQKKRFKVEKSPTNKPMKGKLMMTATTHIVRVTRNAQTAHSVSFSNIELLMESVECMVKQFFVSFFSLVPSAITILHECANSPNT